MPISLKYSCVIKKSRFTGTQIVLLLKVKLRPVHMGHGLEQHRTTTEDVHYEDNSCNNFLYFKEDENSD